MLFDKYARAISDSRERNRLHGLYVARNVLLVLSIASLIACFCVAATGTDSDGSLLTLTAAALLLLLFGSLILFTITLVLHLCFCSGFKRVIMYGGGSAESREVASYRDKYAQEQKNERRALALPFTLFILLIFVGIVMIAVDVSQDNEIPWYTVGAAAMCVGIFGLFLTVLIRQYKRVSNGETFEQRSADDAEAIDAQQGRKHKYRLAEDVNAQRLDYLFPNEELCAQAQAIRAKHVRRMSISLILGLVLSLSICVIFLSGIIFKEINLQSWCCPVGLSVIYMFVFIGLRPLVKHAKAVEDAQYAELKERPDLEANLRLFETYGKFNKTAGRILLGLRALSVVVSVVLAAFFPSAPLFPSLGALTCLIVTLAVNFKTTKNLRMNAIKIEDEIDARENAKRVEQASEQAEQLIAQSERSAETEPTASHPSQEEEQPSPTESDQVPFIIIPDNDDKE